MSTPHIQRARAHADALVAAILAAVPDSRERRVAVNKVRAALGLVERAAVSAPRETGDDDNPPPAGSLLR